MKTPEQILQEIDQQSVKKNERRATVGIIQGIISDAKSFFTNLFNSLSNKHLKNTYKVDVKNQITLPDIQKVSGEVSIKDLRSLIIGLNEIITKQTETIKSYETGVNTLKKELKPEKVDFSSLKKAIDDIKIPETKIPDYPKSISINNLVDLKTYFDQLAKKFDIKIPETKIPDYPKEIKVSNFPKVEPVIEEEMTGFYWNKNEVGEMTELVEQYPSGDVISTGFAIGRVKINEKKK